MYLVHAICVGQGSESKVHDPKEAIYPICVNGVLNVVSQKFVAVPRKPSMGKACLYLLLICACIMVPVFLFTSEATVTFQEIQGTELS